MTIAQRKQEVEQTFNTKQAEREQHLKAAEECLSEMTKLQGSYATLSELEAEEDKPAKKPKSVNRARTIVVEDK